MRSVMLSMRSVEFSMGSVQLRMKSVKLLDQLSMRSVKYEIS